MRARTCWRSESSILAIAVRIAAVPCLLGAKVVRPAAPRERERELKMKKYADAQKDAKF